MERMTETKITDIESLNDQTITSKQRLIIAEDLKHNRNLIIPKKNIDLVREVSSRTSKKSWIPEVLLGFATASLGSAFSFFASGVSLNSWKGVVGFIIMPLFTVGCGVAYAFLRHSNYADYDYLCEVLEKQIFSQINENEETE